MPPIAPRSTFTGGGRHRRDLRSRAEPNGALPKRRARPIAVRLSSTVIGTHRPPRVDAVRLVQRRPTRSAGARCSMRPAADVRRVDAERTSVFPVARQAPLRRGAGCLRARPLGRAGTLGRGLPRRVRPRRGAGGRCGGGEAASRAAGHAGARARTFPTQAPAFGTGGMPGALPQGNSPGASGRAPRRSSISRTMSPPRISALATREGFQSIEHVKRYTTTGMATDQGKTSNMNALGIVAEALGRADPAGRADDLSDARHAGDLRHVRRVVARRSVRPRARPRRSTPGPWSRARCSRTWSCGSGPVFPAGGRRHACGGGARMPGRARGRRDSSTARRSARSRWSGRTPPSS